MPHMDPESAKRFWEQHDRTILEAAAERVKALTKLVCQKMSKSGEAEAIEYVKLDDVLAILDPITKEKS